MLYWDKKWKESEKHLSQLSADKLWKFACQNIQFAVDELGEKFFDSLGPRRKTIIEKCIDTLNADKQTYISKSSDCYEKVEELLDDDDVVGFFDVLMGLQAMFNFEDQSQFTAASCYDVLSFSYQAVLAKEIISKLTHNVTETEVSKMEANNKVCCHFIDRQLEQLSSLL